QVLDETDALGLQAFDNMAVVHDFVANVDRRAVLLECFVDDFDRADDSGAKAAGLSKHKSHAVSSPVVSQKACDLPVLHQRNVSHPAATERAGTAFVSRLRRSIGPLAVPEVNSSVQAIARPPGSVTRFRSCSESGCHRIGLDTPCPSSAPWRRSSPKRIPRKRADRGPE